MDLNYIKTTYTFTIIFLCHLFIEITKTQDVALNLTVQHSTLHFRSLRANISLTTLTIHSFTILVNIIYTFHIVVVWCSAIVLRPADGCDCSIKPVHIIQFQTCFQPLVF
ncbi:Hypothetical_protein [Hexamita inflata]|uniref:Hypothetical_protein n=1 Tax=Hexamita inflata TaxID=28002 RepID=A0ABP1H1Q7_9EUKA